MHDVEIDVQHEASCQRVGGLCCRHPQNVAANSDADILIYGGAAGSGKSFFLAYDAGKHVQIPQYGGIFFRRTAPELQGPMSLWEETKKLYPLLGGESRESPRLEWKFPAGSLLQLSHLQHTKDVSQHQSKRYGWIGFDELTTFDEEPFWFLVGRAGSMVVRPKIRGTCNPDPDSFVAKLIAWWLDKDGYAIAARSGVKRWFWRMPDGALQWADSAEELLRFVPETDHQGVPVPREARLKRIMSLTFVAAKLSDNALFEKADPSYRAKLEALPPVLRARFLGGNWRVRASSGDYFQRAWFPRVGSTQLERELTGMPQHLDYVSHVRCWDLAGTPMRDDLVPGVARPEGTIVRATGNPDWTRGLLASLVRDSSGKHRGKIVLRDLKSWRDTPGAVRQGIVRQAKQDPRGTTVVIFHDPAQAGIDQIEQYQLELKKAGIGHVLVLDVTKSKIEYAGPASRLAFNGAIWVDDPEETWSVPFFNEIEQFPPPPKTPKGTIKQDCTDVLSGVVRALEKLLGGTGVGEDVEDKPRTAHEEFMYGSADEDYGDPEASPFSCV